MHGDPEQEFKSLYDIRNLQTWDRKKLKNDCTHLQDVLSISVANVTYKGN